MGMVGVSYNGLLLTRAIYITANLINENLKSWGGLFKLTFGVTGGVIYRNFTHSMVGNEHHTTKEVGAHIASEYPSPYNGAPLSPSYWLK